MLISFSVITLHYYVVKLVDKLRLHRGFKCLYCHISFIVLYYLAAIRNKENDVSVIFLKIHLND